MTAEPSPPDKKARAAAALTGDSALLSKAPPPKAPPLPGSDLALKAMEAAGRGEGKGKGKDKGSGGQKELGLCHHFADGKGCKYGDSCRFKHDRALARKQRRCLACGQEGHYRPECPLVAPENRMVQDGSFVGDQPPAAKAPPPRKFVAAKGKAGPQAKGITEDPGPSGPVESAATSAATGSKEALIAEAAKLLKGVSLKPVRVKSETSGCISPSWSAPSLGIDEGWLRSAVVSAADQLFALVDSGATNALRPAEEGELQGARLIKVDLASGGTELHVNQYGTLLSTAPCQVIVPAGYLVQLGFSIAWKRKGCVIKRGGERPLEVKVVKGCPLISREKGIQLLEEYEGRKLSGNLASLKKVGPFPPCPVLRMEARNWLAARVAAGKLAREDQINWLRAMCPEAPMESVLSAAGLDIDPNTLRGEGTPWNRRKRRTVMRARPGEVLLHLFSGQQKWRCPGIMIEVEKSRGVDLMATWVFQHVLTWALIGVVGGVVGGPPCRTASVCRSSHDGGPPPVRDRDQGRWGLSDLAGSLQAVVREDNVLWLGFLLVFGIAQAAADSGVREVSRLGAPVPEEPGEPILTGRLSSSGQEQLVVPDDINDPLELARWALRAAAERMQPTVPLVQGSRRVLFAWEHPADPESYMPPEQRPPGGWASWWSFPEWKVFKGVYDLLEARVDQGCLKKGHPRPKPTVVATNSWYLYESLHMRILSREERARFGNGPAAGSQRLQQSPLWGRWAPGLTAHVIQAWVLWGKEQGLWQEVQLRKVMLAKLKEEEAFKRHLESDHVPFRKGCPVCIASRGRQRPHWRASTKTVFSASFDLAGPFVPGRGYDPAASGRDRGLGYRYFLACAFTMPVQCLPEAASLPVPEELEPSIVRDDTGAVADLPDWGELFGDSAMAVRTRARVKRPEAAEVEVEGQDPLGSVSKDPDEPPPLPPPAEPQAHKQVWPLFPCARCV